MTVTTFSFTYSGGIEDWVVPFHTGTIRVDVVGGYGGREQGAPGGAGGNPGTISGTATIAAGTVLHLIVGQSGGFGPTGVAGGPSLGRAGGYPRGGAASEVRIGGTSLADTKIVAGGGGGAGTSRGAAGGAGGAGNGTVPTANRGGGGGVNRAGATGVVIIRYPI